LTNRRTPNDGRFAGQLARLFKRQHLFGPKIIASSEGIGAAKRNPRPVPQSIASSRWNSSAPSGLCAEIMTPGNALDVPLAPVCVDKQGGDAPLLTPGDKLIRNPPKASFE
jgi:hypothetical protein